MSGPAAFPRLRWAALAWLAVWATVYARSYPLENFLQLCDIAVILTCVGLWMGSPLLLSTQALSSIVIDVVWDLDLAFRGLTGRHLVGGTEYMWDAQLPVALRALSLFHLVWPPLLWWALRRVGYDPRALAVQSVLAAVVLAASRLAADEANVNFAWRDPFLGRQWGTGAVHVALMAVALVGIVYVPTHALLRRMMPRPEPSEPRSRRAASPPAAAGGSPP